MVDWTDMQVEGRHACRAVGNSLVTLPAWLKNIAKQGSSTGVIRTMRHTSPEPTIPETGETSPKRRISGRQSSASLYSAPYE
eukprot:6329808-Amphidinium_carterae.1